MYPASFMFEKHNTDIKQVKQLIFVKGLFRM